MNVIKECDRYGAEHICPKLDRVADDLRDPLFICPLIVAALIMGGCLLTVVFIIGGL